MSTSGSFTGSRGGNDYGPRLILEWSRIETDISGNRSRIRLTLKVDPYSGRGVYASANKTGRLHGSSFTYTGGFNGDATKTIHTRNVWVNHKSDGSASVSFSATFNIDLTWHGSKLNSISVSGTANIRDIPRASGLTAFSLNSSSIAESTSRTIRYTLDRKSSSFSHAISLRLGNRTIKSWTDSGTGSRTESLTTSNANTILKALSSTTSGTLTLRVQTKSGNTNIGSAVTRTTSISVASSVSPSASGMSTSISGDGRDDAINRYVQSITRVYASFTRSAGYGASISSTSIVVRRVSGSSNSQTISGRSGTTANPVSLSGTYEAIGTVKDSRGRTDTSRSEFTVQAYSAPRISKFTASRTTANPATVRVTRNGSYTSLSGLNPTDVEVHKRARNSTSWTRINNLSGHTSGSFGTSFNDTGNSEANAYEFRLTVTDSFGNSARSTVDIGTSFQELTIARGKGIGVGKVWERGSLDVAGEAYFKGQIRVEGIVRILDYLSLGNNSTDADQERLRIQYHGSNGDTTFRTRAGDMSWVDRLTFQGRNGVSDTILHQPLSIDGSLRIETSGSSRWIDISDGNRISSYSSYLTLYSYPDSGSAGVRVRVVSGPNGSRNVMEWRSSGQWRVDRDNLNTTTSSSNVRIFNDSSQTSRIGIVTSKRDTKEFITDIHTTDEELMSLQAVKFKDKNMLAEDPERAEWHLGFIAEDVAASKLPELAEFDRDGEVQSVAYDRVPAAILPVVQRHIVKINDILERLEALEEGYRRWIQTQ